MFLNKVFILGNLTRDPERKQIPTTGNTVVNFGIATNRYYKTPQGEMKNEVEFHNIVMFGKMAETASQYLKKGSMVLVEGRIKTRSWTDNTSGQKRYMTEIIAEKMQLGPRKSASNTQSSGFAPSSVPESAFPNNQQKTNPSKIDEDEIPVIQEEPTTINNQNQTPEKNTEQNNLENNENPFEKDAEEIDVKDIPF